MVSDPNRRFVSEIVSSFEKRSKSTDRSDSRFHGYRNKPGSPTKHGQSGRRPPTPAPVDAKSPRPSSLVIIDNDSVYVHKYLEAINPELTKKQEAAETKPSTSSSRQLSSKSASDMDGSRIPTDSLSGTADSVFISPYNNASTPQSGVPSGARPPVNSLASCTPTVAPSVAEDRLNALTETVVEKLQLVESDRAARETLPPERKYSSGCSSDDDARLRRTPATVSQPVIDDSALVAKPRSAVDSNVPNVAPPPPFPDSPTANVLVESGHYQTPNSVPKDSLALKKEHVPGDLSGASSRTHGEADSFLEKSSLSQQSPLTNSIFKALGMQDASASDNDSFQGVGEAATVLEIRSSTFRANAYEESAVPGNDLKPLDDDVNGYSSYDNDIRSNNKYDEADFGSDHESDDDGPVIYEVEVF